MPEPFTIQSQTFDRYVAGENDGTDTSDYSFIPSSADELGRLLSQYLPPHARKLWAKLTDHIALVVHSFYYKDSLRGFSSFDAQEQDAQQAVFLSYLLHTAHRAGFRPLSEDAFNEAVSVSYRFKQPYSIDLGSLDTSLFARHFEDHPYNISFPNSKPPPFARHILVLVRGEARSETISVDLPTKIDTVVVLVAAAFKALSLGYVASLFRRLVSPRAQTAPKSESAEHADATGGVPREPAACPRASHRRRRVAFEEAYRAAGLVRGLFKPITTREPVFRSVLLVYVSKHGAQEDFEDPIRAAIAGNATARRRAHFSLSSGASSEAGPQTPPSHGWTQVHPTDSHADGVPQSRSSETSTVHAPSAFQNSTRVRLALYDNIPAGDVDATFPYMSVRLRPTDFLVFATQIAVFIAFAWTCVTSLFDTQNVAQTGWVAVLGLVFFELCQRGYGLAYGYITYRTVYERDRAAWLDAREAGKGRSVLQTLVNEVETETVKNLMLGAFWLWANDGPLSVDALCDEVQRFCRREYGVRDYKYPGLAVMNTLAALRIVKVRADGPLSDLTNPFQIAILTHPRPFRAHRGSVRIPFQPSVGLFARNQSVISERVMERNSLSWSLIQVYYAHPLLIYRISSENIKLLTDTGD